MDKSFKECIAESAVFILICSIIMWGCNSCSADKWNNGIMEYVRSAEQNMNCAGFHMGKNIMYARNAEVR